MNLNPSMSSISSSPSPSPLVGSSEGIHLIAKSPITVVNDLPSSESGNSGKASVSSVNGIKPGGDLTVYGDFSKENQVQSGGGVKRGFSASNPFVDPFVEPNHASNSTIVVEGRENFAGFPSPSGSLNQQTQKMQQNINFIVSSNPSKDLPIVLPSLPIREPSNNTIAVTSSISVVNDTPMRPLSPQPLKKQRTLKSSGPMGSPAPITGFGKGVPPPFGRTFSSPSMLGEHYHSHAPPTNLHPSPLSNTPLMTPINSNISSPSSFAGSPVVDKSLIHLDEPHSISIEPVASVQIANRIVQSRKGGKGENKYLQLCFDCKKLLNSSEKGTFKKDQEATLNSFLFDRTSKTFKFPNNLDIRLDNKKMILSLKLKLPKKGQLIGFSHEDCRIMCHIRIGTLVVARGFSNTFNVVCRKDQIKDEDVIVTRESRHQSKKDKDGLLAKFEGSVKNFLLEGPTEMSLSEKRAKMMAILDRVVEETYAETGGNVVDNSGVDRRGNLPSSPITTMPASPAIPVVAQPSKITKDEQSDREETAKAIAMLADKNGAKAAKKTRSSSTNDSLPNSTK